MKNYLVLLLFFLSIISCGKESHSNASHGFAGKFVTETGIVFELNNDSTTVIDFNGTEYTGTWKTVQEDGQEWANIEFAGNQQYYYLHNGALYRSRLNMEQDYLGDKVTYLE